MLASHFTASCIFTWSRTWRTQYWPSKELNFLNKMNLSPSRISPFIPCWKFVVLKKGVPYKMNIYSNEYEIDPVEEMCFQFLQRIFISTPWGDVWKIIIFSRAFIVGDFIFVSAAVQIVDEDLNFFAPFRRGGGGGRRENVRVHLCYLRLSKLRC